jgi:hypothetical protein
MKETDLFPPLKAWLEERGYEVYTEVQSTQTGGRADIVAVNGPVVSVVEMKVTLSLELIGQAVRWRPFANHIYIAVPSSKQRRRSEYALHLLRREGIGLLEVMEHSYGTPVQNFTKPVFNRRINDHIRKSLVEQHKELPGGHAGGGYVTPYKLTIDRVKEYLGSWYTRKTDGWAAMADILEHCETHYASPKASLAAAMKNFESEFFETKVENRKLYFRLKGVIK